MSKEMCFRNYGYKWCPNCNKLEPINFKVSFTKNCVVDGKLVAIVSDRLNNSIDMICDCGTNMIILDSNIADVIAVLNAKGYITEYSCGGHQCEDSEGYYMATSLPYVSFKNDIPVHILKDLPDGWYIDINKDCKTLYFYDKDYDTDEYESSIDFDQRALFLWAIGLEATEESKMKVNSKRYYLREYSNIFAEEKYWEININKYYSHHSRLNDPTESNDTCSNCDGANCDGCDEIGKCRLEFCCDIDKLANAINNVYDIPYKLAYTYAIEDIVNRFRDLHGDKYIPYKMRSSILAEYFPNFIIQLTKEDPEVIKKFKEYESEDENPYCVIQETEYDYGSNEYRHLYNQYVLYNYKKKQKDGEKLNDRES